MFKFRSTSDWDKITSPTRRNKRDEFLESFHTLGESYFGGNAATRNKSSALEGCCFFVLSEFGFHEFRDFVVLKIMRLWRRMEVCVRTWTIVLGSGCVSSSVMATKLNPLNSWWALALGGTPGESDTQTQTAVEAQRSTESALIQSVFQLGGAWRRRRSESRYLWVFSLWTLDRNRKCRQVVLQPVWREGGALDGRVSTGTRKCDTAQS